MSDQKKHWVKLSSTSLYQGPFFGLRCDKVQLASGKIMPRYFVFEYADWVHVIALTPDKQVVLIRQYRHAASAVLVEIPGGTLDPHNHELPEVAAARELLEETGYKAGNLIMVGSQFPNPAAQNNRLWTYVATDCVKVQDQNLDPFEEIEVFTLPFDDVQSWIDEGKIAHALVLASFQLARPILKKLGY